MIAFGKTYYGTVLKMKVVLHNKCPASTNYLVLLDENAVGNEKGVDMSEGLAMACNRGGLAQTRWKEQGFSSEIDSLIQVYPSQVCAMYMHCTCIHMNAEGSANQCMLSRC